MPVDRICQLRAVGVKRRADKEKERYFFESGYKATSCSFMQSLDLSGLGSIFDVLIFSIVFGYGGL